MTFNQGINLLLGGATLTVTLTVVVLVASTLLGTCVAVARTSGGLANRVAFTYTWLFRGLPDLLVLFAVFFALPQLGLTLSPFLSAVTAFVLINAAYIGEIVRAGLIAVPNDQREAAVSLGLSRSHIFARIVLPQAAASVMPAYISQATEVVKGSSIASVIGVAELIGRSRSVMSVLNQPFEIFTAAAVMYIAINTLLLWGESYSQRRFERWK